MAAARFPTLSAVGCNDSHCLIFTIPIINCSIRIVIVRIRISAAVAEVLFQTYVSTHTAAFILNGSAVAVSITIQYGSSTPYLKAVQPEVYCCFYIIRFIMNSERLDAVGVIHPKSQLRIRVFCDIFTQFYNLGE